ncbi:MAG: hypothetical protein MRY74_12340 [Neomegalonema sp.]|nr:hypothetical protein [Neomegalonema sp.]
MVRRQFTKYLLIGLGEALASIAAIAVIVSIALPIIVIFFPKWSFLSRFDVPYILPQPVIEATYKELKRKEYNPALILDGQEVAPKKLIKETSFTPTKQTLSLEELSRVVDRTLGGCAQAIDYIVAVVTLTCDEKPDSRFSDKLQPETRRLFAASMASSMISTTLQTAIIAMASIAVLLLLAGRHVPGAALLDWGSFLNKILGILVIIVSIFVWDGVVDALNILAAPIERSTELVEIEGDTRPTYIVANQATLYVYSVIYGLMMMASMLLRRIAAAT